jgi:hypothetical protein
MKRARWGQRAYTGLAKSKDVVGRVTSRGVSSMFFNGLLGKQVCAYRIFSNTFPSPRC